MTLKNLSKNSIIADDLFEAKKISHKLLGLHNTRLSRSLFLKTRFGIHTFFLKNPIDVLVINNQDVVVKAKTVKPNSIFLYNPLHINVVELKKGSIENSETKVGDKIRFT